MVTILLYVASYKLNYLAIAAIIIYALDISDIFVSFSRIFVEINYKVLTMIFGLLMFIIFLYNRTIVFPIFVFYGMYYYP